MKYLQINVFEYPSGKFLGQRNAPYHESKNGEPLISNSEDVNRQVNEVRILHGKNENQFFFKTQVVNQ